MPKDKIEAILTKCVRGWDKKRTFEPIEQAKQAIEAEFERRIKNSRLGQLVEYGFPRAVGHTTAEIIGVQNVPTAKLIVANINQLKGIKLNSNQTMTISQIPQGLRGCRNPIVVDHFALQTLFLELLSDINEEISK